MNLTNRTPLTLLATLALACSLSAAATEPTNLRLQGNKVTTFEEVHSLTGTNAQIQTSVQGRGYQSSSLQHDVSSWLDSNRGSTTATVYLVIPISPSGPNWSIEEAEGDAGDGYEFICIRRPAGSSTGTTDKVGWLLVTSYTPLWYNSVNSVCPEDE